MREKEESGDISPISLNELKIMLGKKKKKI
jgi:hypothetical protein